MNNTIKLLRNERGLTQEKLAKALGIARPTLSNIERGVCNPNLDLLFRISNYFGKLAEQIFFDIDVNQEEQN